MLDMDSPECARGHDSTKMLQTDYWTNFHLQHANCSWGKVWFKCPTCNRTLEVKIGISNGRIISVTF